MSNFEIAVMDFFSFDRPVPASIKGGEALRKEYLEKENFVKKTSGCENCNIAFLRSFYINKIKDSFNE
jgi:hypothetical protein